MGVPWKKILLKNTELQLIPVLSGGQSFRWKKVNDNEWIGVFGHHVWSVSQDEEHLLYYKHSFEKSKKNTKKRKITNPELCSSKDDELDKDLISNYFNLNFPLEKYYGEWAKADAFFSKAAKTFYGIRMLNQDIPENVFSFICSSNNNIKRISSMVEKLCKLYGEVIGSVGEVTYYDFPAIKALTGEKVENELREAGFGYRAKFIHQSACKIMTLGGENWLESLKSLKYNESKAQLMTLPGIGPKVADCICLMSLQKFEAIPVDTHIFQTASQIYLPHLKSCKSVTDRVYNEIGDHFRQIFGPYAGWAHTIIFCADLKTFQEKEEAGIPKKRKRSK